MSGLFSKNLRLRQKRQFQEVSRAGNKRVGKWIILEWRFSRLSHSRLGITVSRKYGKAHERNRFKRLVREAFRFHHATISEGLDLIIRPRLYAKEATCFDISDEMQALLIF